MLDAQLQTILQSTLTAGFAARITDMTVSVQQNEQPRQFAAPVGPACFHTLMSPKKNYGWPKYRESWNETSQAFVKTRTQVVHTKFVIGACFAQRPGAPNAYSSSDIAATAAAILQDEDFVYMLTSQYDAGVFRITELPAVWFVDSTGQNVLWASFDIIFTHKDVFTSSVGAIDDFVGNIKSV
jgi:hypothetical protein